MSVLLDVTIDGCPTSQRSKVVLRKRSAANGGGSFASLAKDGKTEEWRNAARSAVEAAWGDRAPITEPVKLTIWAVGKRPKRIAAQRIHGVVQRIDPDHLGHRHAEVL